MKQASNQWIRERQDGSILMHWTLCTGRVGYPPTNGGSR
jgi:hypothetical protein